MTGYGRAVRSGAKASIEVVISSFNKRSLDVVLKVPPDLMEIDPFIRKSLGGLFERGALFVSIKEVEKASSHPDKEAVLDIAENRLRLVKKIASHLHVQLTDGEMFSAVIDGTKDSLIFFDKDEEKQKEKLELAKAALQNALLQVQESREKEGAFLRDTLLSRLEKLASIRQAILSHKGDVVAAQTERLCSVLAPYLSGSLSMDERVLKEVVLYADKMDISEEIARIEHHIDHCQQVFQEEGAIGKKIDFLLQELMREFNTLGSKTSNVAITVQVVLAKTELEKMREQVQNVE